MKNREDLVIIAKLAQEIERFDDMKNAMKCLVETNKDLTIEERHLLCLAYKNIIGSKRKSLRFLRPTVANTRLFGEILRSKVLLFEIKS